MGGTLVHWNSALLKAAYTVSVQDDDPGISPQYRDKVFEIFSVLASKDLFGESGNCIGLATLKKLVYELGGTIYLDPDAKHRVGFVFTLPK